MDRPNPPTPFPAREGGVIDDAHPARQRGVIIVYAPPSLAGKGVGGLGSPLPLLLLLALVGSLLTPAPARADSPIQIARNGRVEADQWTSHAFVARAGRSYVVRLTPEDGSADLYLYSNGREVARSIGAGVAERSIRWTASGDGFFVAWVYGVDQGASYQISVTGPDAPSRKVGLQAGHWRRWEAPPPFNSNEGAKGGDKTEDEVNLQIASRAADILKGYGYAVDVLPTLIPKGYSADVVLSIHADGGPADRRGFFADRPARSQMAEQEAQLVALLNAGYTAATGIPYVYRGTNNTRYYYGYASVDPRAPMALIETGFLSNDDDRAVLAERPELPATMIARAIRRFLDGLYWAFE